MALDIATPRSRRALLAATAGSLGAFVAQALGRPAPAAAANGNSVILGSSTNTATLATEITSSSNLVTLWAVNTTTGRAFMAESDSGIGVLSHSNSNIAVYGTSSSSVGVYGASSTSVGVSAAAYATNKPAVLGNSRGNGPGVYGFSGGSSTTPPSAAAKTGVYGEADQDAAAYGVIGVSGPGTGVYGKVTGSSGRYAVRGWSAASVYPAILGQAAGNSTGVHGHSGSIAGAVPAKVGVFGTASQDAAAVGVIGQSGAGVGVRGTSATNDGVQGKSAIVSKSGVWGDNTAGGYGVAGSCGGDASTAAIWGNNYGGMGGVGVKGSTGAGTAIYGFSGTGAIPLPPFDTGVYGRCNAGHGVHGRSDTGYGGYFEGPVHTTRWYELAEIATPANPLANRARVFVRDNGSSKTQLCVKFPNGTVRILATEA
jgi:hypothetical protein